MGDNKSCFNGSTVREPWLSFIVFNMAILRKIASMGPRSENRGYQQAPGSEEGAAPGRLQWVHGPRTVVMLPRALSIKHLIQCFNGSTVREPWLLQGDSQLGQEGQLASMGPRSENRGY